MKTLRLLLAVVLALAPALHAAVPQIWATRYNGSSNGDDIPTSIVVDHANDVIVTGYSTGFGNNDFYTAKYSGTNGAILWDKRYNGLANGDDRAKGVAVDSAGNVAVTGYSTGVGTGFDFLTIKYAADGTPQWEQRYDNGGRDSATSVAMDSAGNVVVTGFSIGTGNYDFYTAKYAAADGALLWEQRYNGPTNRDDVPTSVAVDSADNVIVTGYSVTAAPYTNYYTAKYAAADGALLWEQRYDNGNTFNNATCMAVDSSDNVVVTGSSNNGTSDDYYTAKYAAADGALLWEQRYNGPANASDVAAGVAVDSAGNVAVTGRSMGTGSNYDYYTAKYAAADGALLWEVRHNGNNSADTGAAIAMNSVGNVVVTGYSVIGGVASFYTASYAAADGKLLWENTYGAGGLMLATGQHYLALASDGSAVVTGQSPGTGYDYATVHYGAPDMTTLPPLLTAPASGTLTKSPIAVLFTLPEAAANGTVKLTFAGATTTTLTLTNPQSTSGVHNFTFNPANPTASTAIASGAAIADGTYTVTLQYQDLLLNPAASVSVSNVTIDTIAPDTTLDSGPPKPPVDLATTTATFTFSASEAGSTFLGSLDNGPYVAISSPKVYANLTQGSHIFNVQGVDGAGNADPTPAQRVFYVDTIPPNTTIDSGPSGTGGATAIFTFSSNEQGSIFLGSFDGGAEVAVSSPAIFNGLTEGSTHTFSVRAFDRALNPDPTPATRTWIVDTVPPETMIDSGPIGFLGNRTATFTFSASEAGSTFVGSLDNGPYAPISSPKVYTNLTDKVHIFNVQAIDAAGNADPTPAQRVFTVDTVAPQTTIESGPSGAVSNTGATFTFSANQSGSTFQGSLDGGIEVPLSSPTVYTDLAQGLHSFKVRAIDPAGNVDPTPAARTWTVDTVPPDTTIDSGPSGAVSSTTATFTFSTSEQGVTFLGALDGGAEVAVSSPAIFNSLAQGAHTFSVRAVDGAGNADPTPAVRTWTVDTVPPETTIDSGPTGFVANNTATFTFSASEAGSTFLASFDNGPYVAISSPKVYANLPDGAHIFNVQGVDAAGNADPTPAQRRFTVDTIPPETVIKSGPSGTVNSSTATFTFSISGTFLGSLDGGAEVAVSSPVVFDGLAEGAHTFTLRAVDLAGNSDPTPATRTWTVDTIPPDTTIDSGPSGTVKSMATFAFSSNEPGVTFLASLDGGAEAGVVSPTSFDGLANGPHTFSVRAIDLAGNADPTPATRAWIADSTAPQTTIDSGPIGVLSSSVVTFAFSASELGSTFRASLDGGAESVVTSPATYSDLAAGSHTFSVYALDVAGNADLTPATRTWTALFDPDNTAKHVRGAAVPGAGSGDIPAGAVWLDFGVPAINDAGALAFRGKWSSPAGVGSGIFVDDRLVAGTGDTTQALGPATLATFGEPVLDAAGHVAFVATVEGNGVTPARDSVLMADAFGALEVVAREGAAIGGPGSPKLKTFKSISLVDGEVLFTARLQGGTPAVTAANDFAAFRMASPGSLGHVVRTGDRIGTTVVTAFNLLTAVAGSPGQNRGHAAGTATLLALLANGTQALVESTGGTLTPLVATGATTGGTTLPAATFKSFHIPAADGSRLAFVAALNPGLDGVTAANAQGVFKGEVGGIEPVARVGQTTGVGATTFAALQNPVLAPGADSVAFPATLGGTTAARDASLWWLPAGAPLELLAREGAQPPGVAAGAKWAAFTSLALPGVTGAVGAPRGPLFLATMLPGVGGVDATNNAGVWAVDTSGELRLLFRKGAVVMGKKLKNFTVLNGVSGSPGVTRAFNNNGQVAWRAQFIDGTTAIVVTQVP